VSRRVISPAPSKTRGGPTDTGPAIAVPVREPVADDFLGRLIKYIPAEIVGLFVAVRSALPPDVPPLVSWIIAGVAWLLVPIYFWIATTRDGNRPMVRQIVFATIAFPVWVFALGGSPVDSWVWFKTHSYIASVLLIFVSVLFGWLQPRPGE
jgi:hypothetical protein